MPIINRNLDPDNNCLPGETKTIFFFCTSTCDTFLNKSNNVITLSILKTLFFCNYVVNLDQDAIPDPDSENTIILTFVKEYKSMPPTTVTIFVFVIFVFFDPHDSGSGSDSDPAFGEH